MGEGGAEASQTVDGNWTRNPRNRAEAASGWDCRVYLEVLLMNTPTKELPQFVRDLIASTPSRGQGLNNWLFRVARVLHPYRQHTEIVALLQAVTAGEPIKAGEIERAVANSASMAWQPGQANAPRRVAWPKVNKEQRAAVIASTGGLADLQEISPIRYEDAAPHTEEIIDRLFPDNPLLCCGASSTNFNTRPREDWRGGLSRLKFIVPSPMTALTGKTKDGRISAHTLDNTGARRFLVVEQDIGSPDDQAGVLLYLASKAPLALAVHSGSKSIHGWFYCHGQPEESLHSFMRHAVEIGCDRATWTRSQFVRIPDGTHDNGSRQAVYYFNPEIVK